MILAEIIFISVFCGLVVAFMTFLTDDLAENGLTSSGLGSIILSLLAPMLVFLVTLKLKQQLKVYFWEDKSTKPDESTHLTA